MYNNLKAEMARKGILSKDIAQLLGISPKMASIKITGKSDFRMSEVLAIKSKFFTEMALDYLFGNT